MYEQAKTNNNNTKPHVYNKHLVPKFSNNPFLDDLFELSLHDVQLKESEDLFSNNNNSAVLLKCDTINNEENYDLEEFDTKMNHFDLQKNETCKKATKLFKILNFFHRIKNY